ncbi:hypothetical protein THER5_1902 [Bifidobacterium thermacidophilum subsp. thermacidophilum]|uniref:Uncharacterized protein n=1 Tax=Bifidobacterium thermacidophilum subsp. thermacidophilum TaxID=79262 RepID=A0A087E298_9BIFI|nr:hypothetical protein THER5_1902 [Bifidobacterium thermacidophilum subsp. thermacidophilum]
MLAEPRTESENDTRNPIQSVTDPTATRRPATILQQNRRIPTIHNTHEDQAQHTGHATDQIRGPNRESHHDIGISPHRRPPTPGHQPRHHRETTEYQ